MSVTLPVFDPVTGFMRPIAANDPVSIPTSKTDVMPMTNGESSAITIGMAVYVSASGTVKKARANAGATTDTFGLVFESSVAAAAVGQIATDGLVTATTAQWDALTGDTGGLTPNASYYLSATPAGGLTKTPPATTGNYTHKLGKAISPTEFKVSIDNPYGPF